MVKVIGFIIKYKYCFLAALVAMVIALAGSVAYLVYHSRLHIDENEISNIYGTNGITGYNYEFEDEETMSAVRDALPDLKYVGSDKGNTSIYQTYITVLLDDGTRYHIKYYDSEHVYISAGAKRIGVYSCSENLAKVARALETKFGIGVDGYTVN